MARGADAIRIPVIDWERRVLRMIESGLQPVGGVVTGLARRGEELRLSRMSRIRRSVVVGLMTSDAHGWQRRVVIVDVTVRTEPWRRRMHAGQRERRVVVIEARRNPRDGVMAHIALLRET